MSTTSSTRYIAALGALTLLALCLRVIGLNTGLWWDEIFFLIVSVRHPLQQIVTVFPGDNQHPLYSVLAWMSVNAFGEHAWTLRLPAMLFGVASVPMLYLLGASVARRPEALLAAAFLTVSYHHVWFSQDARGYSALAFWTLAATWLLLRGLRTQTRGPWIGYGIVVALGVYTHLTMMFLVASHLLICIGVCFSAWKTDRSAKLWKYPLEGFLLAGLLTLIFYAPILTQIQTFFLHKPSSMKAVSTPRWALLETVRVLILGLGTQGVLVGAALVAACGAWSYFRQDRVVFALFALPVAITAMGALLARGTMYPRFYFFLIGFAILIL
ncbi:MAG: glycosyltransferase family 39 protein, partial [Terriglobia bacterium]